MDLLHSTLPSRCLPLSVSTKLIAIFPNRFWRFDRVPLILAVQLSNVEAIQLLIQAEADVNVVDEVTGKTPLHFAVELGELGAGIVEFLIRSGGQLDGSGLTPIHLASIVESKEPLVAITKVVGGGEVLDLPDGQGLTPLMYACSYGNEENVKFLIKKKVKY